MHGLSTAATSPQALLVNAHRRRCRRRLSRATVRPLFILRPGLPLTLHFALAERTERARGAHIRLNGIRGVWGCKFCRFVWRKRIPPLCHCLQHVAQPLAEGREFLDDSGRRLRIGSARDQSIAFKALEAVGQRVGADAWKRLSQCGESLWPVKQFAHDQCRPR